MKKGTYKTMLEQIQDDKNRSDWVKAIEDYCNINGITPQELMDFHKNYSGRKVKINTGNVSVRDLTRDKSVGKPYDPNPLFKSKMSVKEK